MNVLAWSLVLHGALAHGAAPRPIPQRVAAPLVVVSAAPVGAALSLRPAAPLLPSGPLSSLVPLPEPAASLLAAPAEPITPEASALSQPPAAQDDPERAASSVGSLFDFSRKFTGDPGFSKMRQNGNHPSEAEALFARRGVATQRSFALSQRYVGLTLSPVRMKSPLNTLANSVYEKLGVALKYMPELVGEAGSQKPGAIFTHKDKTVYMAHPDRPEFYSALLHELRHGYYHNLLERGDFRLYHMIILGPKGGEIGAGAKFYADNLSLEELSTYPKTLRHIVQAMEHGVEMKHPETTIEAFRDALKTTAYLVKSLDPKRGFLSRPLGGTPYFYIDLENKTTLLMAAASRRDADRDLAARRVLLASYLEKVLPLLEAYDKALLKGDLSRAKKAASGMIAAAAKADADFITRRDSLLPDN